MILSDRMRTRPENDRSMGRNRSARHVCTKCRKKRLEKFLEPVRDSDKPGSRVWICSDGCLDGRMHHDVLSYLQEGQSSLMKGQSHGTMVQSVQDYEMSDGYPARSLPAGESSNVFCGHNGQSDVPGEKCILDACCGNRMFWFNKAHPNALYIDIRGDVAPDDVQDFRSLRYKDNSFNLVVWDPPHVFEKSGKYGWLNRKYGVLEKDSWTHDLRAGFDECMRVLKDRGVLIFKWSEGCISVSTILSIIQTEPLFGHTSDKKNKTHWLCFMKMPGQFIARKPPLSRIESRSPSISTIGPSQG